MQEIMKQSDGLGKVVEGCLKVVEAVEKVGERSQ